MTYREYSENVKEVFNTKLNDFLKERKLAPIKYYSDNSIKMGSRGPEVAIYPASPQGETYKEDADGTIGYVTIEYYCDENLKETSIRTATDVYSAILDFVKSQHFGLSDRITTSVLLRVDTGYENNGGLFLLESRISYKNDWE